MKRMLALFLAVCLLPCAVLAELSDDVMAAFKEQTEALTALMAECAGTEAYAKLYVDTGSEAAAVLRKIAGADWSSHRSGTVYVLKDGAIEAFVNASGISLKDFLEAPAAKVRQSVVGSIPTAVASQSGAAFLSAASALRTGTVFLADDAFPEYALVFLGYNGNYGVLCSFVKNGDNIVSASLVPVPAASETMLKRVLGLRNLFSSSNNLYEEYPLN